MKTRGLAIALAVVLAGGATFAVFLYVQSIKDENVPQAAAENMVTVIVPKQDLPAGTSLDGLISAGAFTTVRIPAEAVVPGAVTDLQQLQGRATSTFILQGEQISTARLQGSRQPTGGLLGIPAGYRAASFQLEGQRVVNGVVQPGDHVRPEAPRHRKDDPRAGAGTHLAVAPAAERPRPATTTGHAVGAGLMSAERRVIAVGAPPTFRQQVARAMDTDPENVEWTPTVSVAESLLTEDGHAPNALVLSPTIKEVDAFGFSEFVGRMSPVSAVLLVRDRQANGVLPAAMRSGIRDVIDLSRGGEELRDALKRALEWSENLRAARDSKPVRTSEHRATVISVFSSKGGTGKTFLSCNMAWAIAAETQKDTALLDLEIDHADTFSYFGKEPNIPIQDLLALGEEEDREAILETGTKLGEHLWGYAPPPTMEDVSGEAMGKVIRAFRDNFHFVVVDGSSRYSDAALAAFD